MLWIFFFQKSTNFLVQSPNLEVFLQAGKDNYAINYPKSLANKLVFSFLFLNPESVFKHNLLALLFEIEWFKTKAPNFSGAFVLIGFY